MRPIGYAVNPSSGDPRDDEDESWTQADELRLAEAIADTNRQYAEMQK